MKKTFAIVLFTSMALASTASAVDLRAVTDVNANVGANPVTTDAQIQLRAETSVDASTSTDERRALDVTGALQIDGGVDSTLDAVLYANTAGSGEVTSPQQVNSETTLQAYVQQLKESDIDFGAVTTTQSAVTVEYVAPAKLFGFISIQMSATVTVDADGNATISRPWYAFLTTGSDTELEAQIESEVKPTINTNAQLSAHAQARVVDAVYTALKANISADTQASIDAL